VERAEVAAMNPMDLVIHVGAWGQHHSREVLGGLAAVPVLVGLARLAQRRHHGDPTTHGSARWATPREAKRAGLHADHGVVVGRLKRRILFDDSNTHVLLTGPTRSGKGTSVIGPTLRTWRQSALILDPKDGENADITVSWREQSSQIALFTPCRAPQACINILDTIRLGTRQEFGDAQLIAQSLVAPEKLAHESATSLHFRDLAALLLTATILHVCYTAQRKSLAGVWDFLTQQHASLADCLTTMATTAHGSYGVHQAIASMTTAIKNISGDRELSSVWTTAIRPLVLYSDPMIAASTDTSTLDLDDLQYGPEPLSLYLIAPSPMALERLHPLYRVILDVALTRLMEHPVRTWTSRLLFCGDELPWYGYTRVLDKGISVIAGYGIKGLLVTQDLPMLEEVYGPRTAIWGNTDLKIFHAPTNDLTAKRISENILGRGTVAHPVESRQEGLLGQRSVSLQHVARSLLTTDEVMELDPRLQIVRLSGVKPILCKKVNYRTDPEFGGRRCAA
jgi:type IV secretion system protein VirD4